MKCYKFLQISGLSNEENGAKLTSEQLQDLYEDLRKKREGPKTSIICVCKSLHFSVYLRL